MGPGEWGCTFTMVQPATAIKLVAPEPPSWKETSHNLVSTPREGPGPFLLRSLKEAQKLVHKVPQNC